MSDTHDVVIIGAGPAGLSAAYSLSQKGKKVLILEKSKSVGGLAKSFDLWGQRVDLGPHRFLSNDRRINELWVEVLEDDFELIQRCTRVFFDRQFYSYPLDPINLAFTLDIFTSMKAVLSFAIARSSKKQRSHKADNLEDWFIRQFGTHLYGIFFKSYSEKLWGLSCKEMDADFAGQRIRKLDLPGIIKAILPWNKGKHRTLSDVFGYPLGGAGTLYEKMAAKVLSNGSEIRYEAEVSSLTIDNGTVRGVTLAGGDTINAEHVISTMPLTHLVKGISEKPEAVTHCASNLKFRGTFLAYLLIDRTDIFPDQWIYIQSAELHVGRITNFNNWGSLNSDCKDSTLLCLEMWSSPCDKLWGYDDSEIIQLATEDLKQTGLVSDLNVKESKVIRIPMCYPVYYKGYKEDLQPIQNYLDTLQNLTVIGRYGSYKYNNQDHSLLMGMQAADNILTGKKHNLWELNSDYEEYQEKASLPEVLANKGQDFSKG